MNPPEFLHVYFFIISSVQIINPEGRRKKLAEEMEASTPTPHLQSTNQCGKGARGMSDYSESEY
ncbi:MAG: hypothetical protein LAO21_04135 [Acidobacteriia bacterium]|nr:hypothetical protein [Terriglobia bacterium]